MWERRDVCQSLKFIEAHHQGKKSELAVYGQENIEDYVKLCKMNLAIRGLSGEIFDGKQLPQRPV